MKALYFLIIALLLVPILSKAQSKIGWEKNHIMEDAKGSKDFANIGTSKDGVNYLLYRDKIKRDFMYIYYFDNSGVCISDGIIMPNVSYPSIVQAMNNGYKNVANDIWEDTVQRLLITLQPVQGTNQIMLKYEIKEK